MSTNSLESRRDLAFLILRLGFGIVFIAAGYRHAFGNPEGYVGLFSSIGIPAPDFVAPVVAWLELLGGVAVLLGILTGIFGGLLAIVMAVAISASRIPAILTPREGMDPPNIMGVIGGIQAEICLLALGVFLLLVGGGRYAFDHLFSQPKT